MYYCSSCNSVDQLIQLVEVLGSHSIVAAELKQIIGSLRTTEDGKLPTYYYRLQQALCAMASNKEGITPLYYFDLRQTGSCISIDDLQTWPNSSGFTFHGWVCLNVPSSLGRPIQCSMEGGEGGERIRRRRMLYRLIYYIHIINYYIYICTCVCIYNNHSIQYNIQYGIV